MGFTVKIYRDGKLWRMAGYSEDREVIEGYATDLRDSWKRSTAFVKPSSIKVASITKKEWEASLKAHKLGNGV